MESKYGIWSSRSCRFYVEVNGYRQIFVECGVYCDENPDSIWLRKVPEKYKNDFIMLWKKAHKEEVEYSNEQMKKHNKALGEEYSNALISNNNQFKDFYKQCYKTLAKSVHPDEGGDVEAMQCLNQLKVMWEI